MSRLSDKIDGLEKERIRICVEVESKRQFKELNAAVAHFNSDAAEHVRLLREETAPAYTREEIDAEPDPIRRSFYKEANQTRASGGDADFEGFSDYEEDEE